MPVLGPPLPSALKGSDGVQAHVDLPTLTGQEPPENHTPMAIVVVARWPLRQQNRAEPVLPDVAQNWDSTRAKLLGEAVLVQSAEAKVYGDCSAVLLVARKVGQRRASCAWRVREGGALSMMAG